MTSVWVKVYIGKHDEEPKLLKIKPIPEDIYDLKKKIKEEKKPRLDYLAADQLDVYPEQENNDNSLPWMNGVAPLNPRIGLDEWKIGNGTFVVLTPPPEPKQEVVTQQQVGVSLQEDVTIIVKYKQFKTNWTTSNRDERNLVELENFVRETWGSVGKAQLMFHNNNVRMTDELLAELKDRSVVQVVNTQVGFSTIRTLEKALKLVGCEQLDRNDDAFPKEVTLGDDDDIHVEQAFATIRSLSGIVEFIGGCEATRRMYIDPILCASGLVAKEVKMKVETTVEDPQVSGPVDYLFTFKDKVICVTEGKKDQLDLGISQNIAQLFAIRNTRKRKYENISKAAVFGIATTFVEWVFIKYEGDSVTASKSVVVDMEQRDSIARIIGRIVALLRQCKDDVNPEPADSKQRR